MGTSAAQAIEAAEDLELAARVGSDDPLTALTDARVEVVVDLTRPDVVMDNLAFCLDRGIHVVVGTSGVDEDRLSWLTGRLTSAPGVGVIVAPNFAVGAVLMTHFTAQAARFFESVEIIELHHPDKVDAPSGTARRTAELVAESRRTAGRAAMPDATTSGAEEARGLDINGVRVHSVRARGLVAHQEVILGGAGETLTIRHDSYDRESFMPGVLLGIREVAKRPGLTVGLDVLLGL